MTALSPRDLLDLSKISGLRPEEPVSLDTETSGLYADDGARVSTVSVAWPDFDGDWLDFGSANKAMSWAIENICPECNYQVPIVSVAWPFDQGVAGKPEDRGQFTLWPDAENLDEAEWEALIEWLDIVGPEVGLTMHNAPFDCLMMNAGVRTFAARAWLLPHVTWDTQTGNNLIYPLAPDPDKGGHPTSSLKPVSRHLFGTDIADEAKKVRNYLLKKKLPKGRWDLMPWDIIGEYADKDARLTAMLRLRQVHDLEVHELDSVTDRDRSLGLMYRRFQIGQLVTLMERRGLPYDEMGSRDAADQCMALAKEIEAELPFHPNNAKDFYFGEGPGQLALPPYELTPKGAPSLTAEVLERMVGDNVPHARLLADYNKVTNAASMWYTGYADRMGTDGRLRTRFRQFGTVSTRFSVERVNLQAIPQDYRLTGFDIMKGIPTPRELIARGIRNLEGYRGWELDLAQAELRVGALFAKCGKMLEMIEQGEDLHAFTTRELFHLDQDHPKWGEMRQVGKRSNFSLLFEAQGPTLRKMIRKETGMDLGEAMADRIVRDWNRLYPEFGRANDSHLRKVQQRQNRYGKGWIDLLNGERRWFQRYEDPHKAFNQRVQGNLAQFGLDWMLLTEAHLADVGLDPFTEGLILTIHDSQVLLLPDTAEGEEMAQTCAQFGRELWKEWFPEVPGDVDIKEWGKK